MGQKCTNFVIIYGFVKLDQWFFNFLTILPILDILKNQITPTQAYPISPMQAESILSAFGELAEERERITTNVRKIMKWDRPVPTIYVSF